MVRDELVHFVPLRRTRTAEEAVTVVAADGMLRTQVRRLWADSTWKSRKRLWRRLSAWLQRRSLPLTDANAVRFVVATSTRVQGPLKALP